MDASLKTQILILKGAISELPPEDQEKIKNAQMSLRAWLEERGEHGSMALSLVCAEIAAEA